ncbi:MAG: sigma-70 family RNA polymerase sigma factor [Balneolaceae bacterium]
MGISTKTEFFKEETVQVSKNKKDDVLWSEIKKGNKEALADLFSQYYNYLFYYAFKIVSNEEFVKDCIQELFFTIWNRKENINQAYSVNSYLLSSLRRIVFRKLNKQRKNYERNKEYIENHSHEVFNTEQVIINFETKNETRHQLRLAFNNLRGRRKEIIYLKFYNGLSNSEIAKVMGIEKQSVYNYVSCAIQQLQAYVR